MPNDYRSRLANSLATSGPNNAITDEMEKRRQALAKKKMTGGMLDFIFKRRMDRQQQMQDTYGDM